MSENDRPPKYAQIPTTHLPTLKKPLKFFIYFSSAVLFNYLTYREVTSPSPPTEGVEGSMMGRFQHWFYSRSKSYAKILLALIVIIQLYGLCLYPNKIPLQVYGLTLDMVGAVVVARGLFRGYGGFLTEANLYPPEVRNPEKYNIERPTNREINSLDSEVRSSVDALLGGGILMTGFLVQIISIL